MTVCALAAWRGRDDERLAAGGLLANWAISLVVVQWATGKTQWEEFACDLALLGLYIWLALRSRRYWPLFATGFQVLVVVTHLGHAVDPSVGGWAYMTAGLIWAYLVMFTIGYGAWTAPRFYALSTEGPPTDDPGAMRR